MDLIISKKDKFNLNLGCLFDPKFNYSLECIVCKSDDLKSFCSNPNEYNSYYVFRYLYENHIPETLNIKFDITVIPPMKNINVIPRTRGHYHSNFGNPPKQYFDIYQVVNGQIIFQTHLPGSASKKAFFWFGMKGDIFVLPPSMCHVLYNYGIETAVLSNWCTRNEHLDYTKMILTKGPAFDICGFNNETVVVKRNTHFNNNQIIPSLISPKSINKILKTLGFKSEYIFDWAFEGERLNIMNNPEMISNWLPKFSKPLQNFKFNELL